MFKKWRVVLAFSILFIVSGLTAAEAPVNRTSAKSVSILKLIISPETYLGREISVKGYLSDMRLFAYESDSEVARIEHAILLTLFEQGPWEDIEGCMNHYAIVTGTLVDTELMMSNITSIRVRNKNGGGYKGCYKWVLPTTDVSSKD